MKNQVRPTIDCLMLVIGGLMIQAVAAQELFIEIEKVEVFKRGNIIVMLYGVTGFPKDHSKAISTRVIPATKSIIHLRFYDVPEEFAIKVLHDEDESGEVTKNWTGFIPAEGLAFSNGARLRFGPPSFKKAKLNVTQVNGPLKLEMIYP